MTEKKQDERNPERRAEILRVAAEIFNEKGYRVATLNDISDRLGFTRAALYYWFSGKQEILTAIVLEAGQALLDGLAATLAVDAPPKERLRSMLETHVRVITSNPEAAGVFMAEKASLTPEDRKHLEAGELEYVHGLAKIIEDGIASGEFADQPAVPAAMLMVGMVSWTRRWYDSAGDLSPADLTDLICDFALAGLQRKGRPKSKGKQPAAAKARRVPART